MNKLTFKLFFAVYFLGGLQQALAEERVFFSNASDNVFYNMKAGTNLEKPLVGSLTYDARAASGRPACLFEVQKGGPLYEGFDGFEEAGYVYAPGFRRVRRAPRYNATTASDPCYLLVTIQNMIDGASKESLGALSVSGKTVTIDNDDYQYRIVAEYSNRSSDLPSSLIVEDRRRSEPVVIVKLVISDIVTLDRRVTFSGEKTASEREFEKANGEFSFGVVRLALRRKAGK